MNASLMVVLTIFGHGYADLPQEWLYMTLRQ